MMPTADHFNPAQNPFQVFKCSAMSIVPSTDVFLPFPLRALPTIAPPFQHGLGT